MTFGAKTVLP